MPGTQLEAGKAFVDLVPRLDRGFGARVEKDLNGPLSRIRGRAMQLGKVLAVGIGAGVAGGAVALYAAAKTLDGAFDTIQAGTGATGKELEGLKQSFRNVGRQVPDDLGKVAEALTKVHQRTGLTGKPLEQMTKQMLTLARVTGSDLNTTMEESTRFFGDWGVKVADQGPAMDALFEISQKTGVGMSDLQARMVKFGAPLRQMGFDWKTSAALIAKFQKEGVNTDLVMGSLRISLGKMAKAGKDPVTGLKDLIGGIKGAGSTAQANAVAIQAFGSRAGPDMAAAIREGRFELGDFLSTIGKTPGAIGTAAKKTDDFGEKFSMLKNRIILAVEPLASKVFDFLNGVADKAAPMADWIGKRIPGAFARVKEIAGRAVEALERGFDRIRPTLEHVGRWVGEKIPRAFAAMKRAIEPVLRAIRTFVEHNPKPVLIGIAAAVAAVLVPAFLAWAAGAAAAAVSTLLAMAPLILLVAAIALVAGAFVYAYQHSETFRKIVDETVAFVRQVVWPKILEFVGLVRDAFGSLVGWVRDHWGQISEAIRHVVNVIRFIVEKHVEVIVGLWHLFGDKIVAVVRGAWDLIRSTVENAIRFVKGIIDFVLALINGDWGKAWDALKNVVGAVWDEIGAVVKFAGTVLHQAIKSVLAAVRKSWDWAWDKMKSVASGIWHGLTKGMKAALNGIIAGIEKAINLAIRVINTALDGIDKAAGPWVNFGEIPEVKVPRLKRGGEGRSPGLSIVGDGGNGSGAEILALPKGASVVPLRVGRLIAEAALSAAGAGGAGVVFADGAVKVDARGIHDPETVGDIAARHIGWRTSRSGKR